MHPSFTGGSFMPQSRGLLFGDAVVENLDNATHWSKFPWQIAAQLPPYEQTLLAWLWRYADKQTCWCEVRQDTLCRNCAMSTTRLKKAIRTLEGHGLIEVIRHRRVATMGKYRISRYRVITIAASRPWQQACGDYGP